MKVCGRSSFIVLFVFINIEFNAQTGDLKYHCLHYSEYQLYQALCCSNLASHSEYYHDPLRHQKERLE